MSDEFALPWGIAEGQNALDALSTACYALIGELDDETREFMAIAAGAGELPAIFPQPDGSFRVEFAGRELGTVVLTELR